MTNNKDSESMYDGSHLNYKDLQTIIDDAHLNQYESAQLKRDLIAVLKILDHCGFERAKKEFEDKTRIKFSEKDIVDISQPIQKPYLENLDKINESTNKILLEMAYLISQIRKTIGEKVPYKNND